MLIENIILAVVILAAVIFIGRRIYLIISSKKLPNCTGCGGGCGKTLVDKKCDDKDCNN